MVESVQKPERRAWALRGLAVAVAGLLIGLACESSGSDGPKDPAEVTNTMADKVQPCFDFKPCAAGYHCVGGVCLVAPDAGTVDGGVSGSSTDTATVATGWVPTTAQRQYVRGIPCGSPQGLAYSNGYLWCADAYGNKARRFTASSASETATATLPSSGIIDIGRSSQSNYLVVAGGDGNLWLAGPGLTPYKVKAVSSLSGVSYLGGQIMTSENNTLTRRNPSNFSALSSSTMSNAACKRLAVGGSMVYRLCGVSGSGTGMTHRVQIYDAATQPTAVFRRELAAPVWASSDGGIEVNNTIMWIIGTGSGTDVNKMVQLKLQ